MTPRYTYLPLLAAFLLLTVASPVVAQTDYDTDDDRLIEIHNLAQLNAIRWDLDGNGAVVAGNQNNYNAAFPNAMSGMGCPSTGCNGYELMADLDFDGSSWSGGAGWAPLGSSSNQWRARFNGNGRLIKNLFINRSGGDNIGLFGYIGSPGRVEFVGITDANVSAPYAVGILAGTNAGTVMASYTTGQVTGIAEIGGLLGLSIDGASRVSASYSTATVTTTSDQGGGLIGGLRAGSNMTARLIASYATGAVTGGEDVGGLVGTTNQNGTITASYATGAVTGTPDLGGLFADGTGVTINSYYDRRTTGRSNTGRGDPKTTAQLQMPTGYTGIYQDWDVDIDGVTGNDDPWDFGGPRNYPVLRVDFNGDGTATWEEFGIQRVPQVRDVSVTLVGEERLVVSWPATIHAEGYKVQWKSGDEDYGAAGRQVVLTDTTYTFENLRAGTEYAIRVIATRAGFDDGQASADATGTPLARTLPTFTDSPDPQRYRLGRAIEPLTLPEATDERGDKVTYTLTDLPNGLEFDAETRILSGTPSEVAERAIYTLTATDTDGNEGSLSFFITVIANTMPSFGDASVAAQSHLRKSEIESMTLPQATGGDGTLTYALTPELPEGLRFDAETLMLSGTPLEAMDETTYTLTATDDDGDEATLMFTIEVMPDPMPIFADTTTALAVQVYQHGEIDPLMLSEASGGDGTLTYTLSPELPEGLTFDAETRTISGTPTEAMDETTYTLTVTDGNGDEATLMFTLVVPDLMPTFGDTTIAAQSYFVNVQTTSPRALPEATGGDGMVVYILLPFLPEGLSFDSDTRTIVGTPTEVMDETTYTYSALDADGDVASLSFTLAVRMPSSDFNGDGEVNFADFILFVGKYGFALGEDGYDARYDLDGDGQIGYADFLIFASQFGA